MKDSFVLVLIIAILSGAGIVEAQQTKTLPRIGYLSIGSEHGPRSNAFFQGLRELGYVEGETILVERRGDPQRRRERLRLNWSR